MIPYSSERSEKLVPVGPPEIVLETDTGLYAQVGSATHGRMQLVTFLVVRSHGERYPCVNTLGLLLYIY